MIKKINTFKSGPFALSAFISDDLIARPLIEAVILYQTVNDLPILPDLASRLNEELIARSIFGTAAIEGSPLREDEVSDLLSNPDIGTTTEKVEREIYNLKEAYLFLRQIGTSESTPLELTEDLIRQIHEVITAGIDYRTNDPGQYRNHLVRVGNEEHGGVYTPPKILDDIRSLMKEFVSWINSTEIIEKDPFVRAALAHYHFSLIHPFGDGNGRTARLIEAIILQSSGIRYVPAMLSNFYYRNMDDYYWAFSKSIKSGTHDITPFVEFVLRGVNESLREIKGQITWYIRIFALRDYFHYLRNNKQVSQRQHDLLTLLLEYQKPFTLNDLFIQSPFKILYRKVSPRTADRDLKKLTQSRLLLVEDKEYNLNMGHLE